jgi:hypothetical protein
MSTTATATVFPAARPGLLATITNRRFLLHYLGMLVAMAAGMGVLLPLWRLAGLPDLRPYLELHCLLMATTMTAGMSAWMLIRKHSWAAIGEMGLAMYLSFAVLFIPYWAGLLDGAAVMMIGHILMLPAMLLAMLHRPTEYLRHRH